MKKGYYIEILLWKKFNLFTLNYKSILCIRYDHANFICLCKAPTLIKENKIREITYKDIRIVDSKKYIVGKIWLDCQLNNKQIREPKEFLKEYINLVK